MDAAKRQKGHGKATSFRLPCPCKSSLVCASAKKRRLWKSKPPLPIGVLIGCCTTAFFLLPLPSRANWLFIYWQYKRKMLHKYPRQFWFWYKADRIVTLLGDFRKISGKMKNQRNSIYRVFRWFIIICVYSSRMADKIPVFLNSAFAYAVKII